MKHIKYPSIEQMRNVVRSVSIHSSFVGLDENNKPIYDGSRPKPTIKFIGTTKAHGTNCSVCYNNNEFWCQSREQLLSLEKDNAGFCFWATQRKEWFIKTINEYAKDFNIDLNTYTITVYGEFVGKGIQSGVAVSQLEKSMLIFGIKVSKPNDEEFINYWLPVDIKSVSLLNIFNIKDFGTWEIDIDFNRPELQVNHIVNLVKGVEDCCPIGKYFNVLGIGEGIVWSSEDYKYIFKTKGEKHSVSKVKSIASVDMDKINSAIEFADYAVTIPRVEQGIQKVCGTLEAIDIKKMGEFLKWIVGDIIKEELDTISDNGLEPKDVNKYISNKARKMFMERL